MKTDLHLPIYLCLFSRMFGDISFIVLHVGDLHSKYEEINQKFDVCRPEDKKRNECFGGFARLAHVIRNYRSLSSDLGGGSEVILLNAGDVFTGSNWFTIGKAKIASDFINLLQPNVSVLGNHEFLYGLQELKTFATSLSSPLVAANINFPEDLTYDNIKKSVILDINGTKIGVIGYISTAVTKPKDLEFVDEIEAVKAECEHLNALGVKILIGLGHSGIFIDEKIAFNVPSIDLIVGGHTHTFLYNGTPPTTDKVFNEYPKLITQPNGKTIPIVHAYAFTKYLGFLNVTFDNNGDLKHYSGNPIYMSPDIPQEEDVLQLLETYRPQVKVLESDIIGTTKVYLSGHNNTCRYRECNFGNLLTDALVAYMSSKSSSEFWTDVPIGIINGATIRNSIEPFNITRSDLASVLPFTNQVVTCSIKGNYLLETLETAVRNDGTTTLGEFLQFSGVHVSYDLRKPPRSRVMEAKARCGHCKVPKYEAIKGDRFYNIVTTNFLAKGGSGHMELRDNCSNKSEYSLTDVDILTWYLQTRSTLFIGLEERIKFVGEVNTYRYTCRI